MQNKHFFSSPPAVMQKKNTYLRSTNVADGFCQLLLSTRTLCRQSLYCHWQATEPGLKGFHSLFEQHYQSLRNAIDIIADHIRALGHTLPDEFSQSAWGTGKDDSYSPSEMVSNLIRGHQACVQEASKVLTIAEATGDDRSSHLAAQRIVAHERAGLLLLALPQS